MKHLSNCLDEVIKLESEKVKLDHWLDDAEATLSEMHKRTNQLSRLRDVTDKYKVRKVQPGVFRLNFKHVGCLVCDAAY